MVVDTGVLVGALVISGLFSTVAAVFLWNERPKSAATALMVVEASLAVWAFAQAGVLLSDTLQLKVVTYGVAFIAGSALGPAALVFALQYTGHGAAVTRRLVAVLVGETAVYAALALTNASDLLLVDPRLTGEAGSVVLTAAGFGPAFWLQTLLNYGLLAVASWFLFRKFVASRNVYRKRTFFFLSYTVLVTVAHAVSSLGLSPLPHHTLGPVTNLLFGGLTVLVFLGFRSYQFLPLDRLLALFSGRSKSLAPVARDRVIEEMRTGVIVNDHHDRIVDINPIGRRILAVDDDRVIGKPITAVLTEDLFVDDRAAIVEDVTAGSYDAVWVQTPTGEHRCFDVTVTGLDDTGDDSAGHVALIHDVTRRERRKQMLESRTTELERQNERLEEFASVVSHDLRNPLSVAHAYVQTARDDADPADLDQALDSLERMDDLIGDLLALAREGQAVDDVEAQSLADAARRAWNHVDTADASLTVEQDATVLADGRRLQQLFENLYRNAIEHGGPDVAVTVGVFDDGTGCYVADDGAGIPDEERERVFGHGYSSARNGTGLGLAIVRNIAEAHGWRIAATASADGGARFEIADVATDARRPDGMPARPPDHS